MEYFPLDLTTLDFPILVLTVENVCCYARDKEDIIRCNRSALKRGFYKGLRIVDSNGFFHSVIDARKVGTFGPFWGYNIFSSQKLKVELLVENREPVFIELPKFKQMLVAGLIKRDSIMDTGGTLGRDLSFVGRASSHREIIKKFCDDFFRKY